MLFNLFKDLPFNPNHGKKVKNNNQHDLNMINILSVLNFKGIFI